jgi:predicted cation transporter
MDGMLAVNIGLLLIFALVLVAPFRVKKVEENLEVFLFTCGVLALTLSGFAVLEGATFGWTAAIVIEALTAPLKITTVYGIPVGIVQIVLLVGFIIYFWHKPLQHGIQWLVTHLSIPTLVFSIIVVLGLVSSVISAILAAIILVELVCALPINRGGKVTVTVVACFSIGLGAALTPLGEPLSTIAVAKLAGPPYNAGFWYLANLLGTYIVPGILALGIIGVLLFKRGGLPTGDLVCHLQRDSIKEVVIRAAKVYLFIMALVFLGDGFKPLILQYIVHIPSEGLYWVNTVSAVLDNATLAAAEIGPQLSETQIKSALMGLLIAGGMLIPGNIPNIISAGKIGITSREWAKIGIPLGLAILTVYFILIFVPAFILG